MANTYTGNVKLGEPAANDTAWNTTLNNNFTALDAYNPLGDLCVTTHEQPSSSLNVDVSAGIYRRLDGSIGTYAGTTSFALTASTTNYVFLDLTNSGALTKNTTGFPTTPNVQLATVVCGSSTITSIADQRVAFAATGQPIITETYASTITFDLSQAINHQVTLTGNATLALANVQVGDVFRILLKQGTGGSFTVTWFSTINWAGGSAPTLTTTAGKTDTFEFLCVATGTYLDLSHALNH